MRTVFTVEVLKGLFLVFFTLLAAHGQLRPIYSIFLQTPAWMNNLAGYISNHLLPSLTLSPPPHTALLPACGQTWPTLSAVSDPQK